MGGLHQPFQAQVAQVIQAQKVADLVDLLLGGDEFPFAGKIDAVIAGEAVGRAAHHHAHFLGAGLPQGIDPGAGGGAPDDGVFDHHHPLALEDFPHRVEFDPDGEIPHALGRLDEGAADVVIADDPHFKGDAGGRGIAQGGVGAGVGEGHHQVGLQGVFPGHGGAQAFAHQVNGLPVDQAVRPGEIDVFEDADGGAAPAGRACGNGARSCP